MKKVVFLTDVRFWHRKTGAHQRIHSLVKFLEQSGFDVTILFAAPVEDERKAILDSGLNLLSVIDDWQPSGIVEKVKWKGKCILNALIAVKQNAVKQNAAKQHAVKQTASKSTNELNSQSATLKSLQTAEFVPRVRQLLEQIKPDVVVVEYVTLAYLLPSKDAKDFLSVLDSHDLLASRNQQFQDREHPHWIAISESEEFDAFRKFDCILAIQENEAVQIRQKAPEVKVIVAGFPVEQQSTERIEKVATASQAKKVTFGYFASDNAANRDSLQWLLDSIWPKVAEQQSPVELVIAGGVCSSLDPSSLSASVSMLGVVKSPEQFYSQVDVVLNPIRFGTGLKIKNIEAISYSRPLITTSHGVEGMLAVESNQVPWVTADVAEQFAAEILRLGSDEVLNKSLQAHALEYAKQLTPQKVYGELISLFR